MSRSAIAFLLFVSLGLAGCGLFGDKKQPLPGERISVLSLDRQLEPDPDLTKIPITLPPPVVNAEWPEPGGYPNHAMQHLALPDTLTQAWRTSIGEGASRYTRVLSQPVVAKGRVYAMDGGVQISAVDAATGNRVWQLDLKPEDERGTSFGGGVAYWNDRALRLDRLCAGSRARSGRRPGHLEKHRCRPDTQRADGFGWTGFCGHRRQRAGRACR